MNNKYGYIIVFCLSGLMSCSINNEVKKIVSDEDEITKTFLKSSLYGRNEFYVYELYFENKVHTYFCEFKDGDYVVIRDTIVFQKNEGDVYHHEIDLTTDQVSDSIKKLKKVMSRYSIEWYRTDWRNTGIAIKMYLADNREVFYVPEKSNFIKKYSDLEKVNKRWFYR